MSENPKRSWFRFSLRSLLTSVIVLGVPLAWIANERRQSQHELQIAKDLQAKGFSDVFIAGPYDSQQLLDQDKPQGWWRDLARYVLGNRVVLLSMDGPKPKSIDLNPLADLKSLETLALASTVAIDLNLLARLKNLQELYLDSPVTDLSPLAELTRLKSLSLLSAQDVDLKPLARLKNLQDLYLDGMPISDLSPLAELTNLQSLNLANTNVSDLSPLARLKKLTDLDVMSTAATKKQIDALKKSLPKCTIRHDPFLDL